MTKLLELGGIPTSMGEIINLKFHLDLIKNQYDQIALGFYKPLWNTGLHIEAPDWPQKKILWDNFLRDLGNLFFTEKPYTLLPAPTYFGGDSEQILLRKLNMKPQKINMVNLLCKGTPLNLSEEYIVITTKVREMEKGFFTCHSASLWTTLRVLSSKYKIVILGERVVEMRKEYITCSNSVFGIYEQIISNLPSERILDLTLPALGETVSSLAQVQQDCLIMNGAKFVITIGLGGNSCMAHSCAKMAIGFRSDNLPYAEQLFSKEYPDLIVTKNWDYFIKLLKGYL